MRSQILTTHDIARMLSVDISTVIEWIDQKKLTGYRTPGGHRRVKREDLIFFLQTYKMPFPEQLSRAEKIILIVDDDKDFRSVLKGFLEEVRPNDAVHEADTGFLAGKMVEEFKPDLVILDVYLPGINGFEVCRHIRQDPDLSETRILAISGRNVPETKDKILDCGADNFLPKPFGLAEFRSAIGDLLGSSSRETAGARATRS